MTGKIVIHNFFSDFLPPMPADKTALGSMPAAGFQYCKSLVSATANGFHIFPPRDARIRYTGAGIEIMQDGLWQGLEQFPLSDADLEIWQDIAPEAYRENLPPFLQRFFIGDTVQVFSGLFVSCAPDWSVLIRPIVNVPAHDSVMLYEGIIEADIFQPVPLFINIRFLSKYAEYKFEKYRPLFQIQAIPRESYSTGNIVVREQSEDDAISDFQWDGLTKTTRIFSGDLGDVALGSYKNLVRSRRKK